MARRARRHATRDDKTIANTSLLRLLENVKPLEPVARTSLQEVEDRREFYPEEFRPPRTVYGTRTRLVVPDRVAGRYSLSPPETIGFANAHLVAKCQRRHVRREVLFATGKGGSRRRQRKPRRDEFSQVKC